MSDIDIKTEYSPQYRRVNVAGIFGGIVAGGVEAVVYSEERRVDRALEVAQPSMSRMYMKRTVELDLIIDPINMKAIHNWLGQKITEYEKVIGKIPSPEEVDSRTRRDANQ